MFKADKDAKTRVNITGGPLAYHYQFEEIYIHYGMTNDQGSEHQVNNYAFPAEVSSIIHSFIKFLQFDERIGKLPATFFEKSITNQTGLDGQTLTEFTIDIKSNPNIWTVLIFTDAEHRIMSSTLWRVMNLLKRMNVQGRTDRVDIVEIVI